MAGRGGGGGGSLASGSFFRSYRESNLGDRVGKVVQEHAPGKGKLRRRF